jgi:hypothetical protein
MLCGDRDLSKDGAAKARSNPVGPFWDGLTKFVMHVRRCVTVGETKPNLVITHDDIILCVLSLSKASSMQCLPPCSGYSRVNSSSRSTGLDDSTARHRYPS